MGDLVKQILSKIGMQNEKQLFEKTTEFLRLLELRSVSVPTAVNEYGKIILCADLAALHLGISFEMEIAVKLSGMRSSQYKSNKRIFEKLLGVNKLIGINDICLQLELNEVSKKATELLELYKKIAIDGNADANLTHPQYAAMAVYQACKLSKKRISKQKIQYYSNLRSAQWSQLELRWNKFIADHYKDDICKNLILDTPKVTVQQKEANEETDEVEDYETWKLRMLLLAKAKLKYSQNMVSNQNNSKQDEELSSTDEENEFVLGS